MLNEMIEVRDAAGKVWMMNPADIKEVWESGESPGIHILRRDGFDAVELDADGYDELAEYLCAGQRAFIRRAADKLTREESENPERTFQYPRSDTTHTPYPTYYTSSVSIPVKSKTDETIWSTTDGKEGALDESVKL